MEMIQNRWKQVLEQKGMTQAEVAAKVGIGKPFFSSVVNGTGVLSSEQLKAICEVIDIDPIRVYSAEVLNAIYGIERKKPETGRVSIKLTGDDLGPFFELKELTGAATNAEVVRFAVQAGLEAVRMWQ